MCAAFSYSDFIRVNFEGKYCTQLRVEGYIEKIFHRLKNSYSQGPRDDTGMNWDEQTDMEVEIVP